MINRHHNFLTCAKAEIWALTVCIVVNGEKFQSHAVTLTLIVQCPMSNLSELFSYSSGQLNHYFFSYRVHRQTHRHTHRQTDGHEYSIVAVDN